MIALALVYVGLAALGATLLSGAKPPAWVRVVLVAALPILSFAVWQAAQAPTGWATTAKQPAGSTFQWGFIREPDAVSHDRGEIELWVIPPGSERPRAYTTPYTRRLHQQVLAAEGATKHGQRVGVTAGPRAKFRFYVQPPPRPPSKVSNR